VEEALLRAVMAAAMAVEVVLLSMGGVVVVQLAAVVFDLKMVGRPLRSVQKSVLLLVEEY
jgi:hypothetical protein